MHDFRFVSIGRGKGRLYMDGVEQKAIRAVKIEYAVDSMTIVTVQYLADEVVIEQVKPSEQSG